MVLGRQLRFCQYVKYVKNNCIDRIKVFGKLRKLVGAYACLMYKALITPPLDYGDMVYDCPSAKDN